MLTKDHFMVRKINAVDNPAYNIGVKATLLVEMPYRIASNPNFTNDEKMSLMKMVLSKLVKYKDTNLSKIFYELIEQEKYKKSKLFLEWYIEKGGKYTDRVEKEVDKILKTAKAGEIKTLDRIKFATPPISDYESNDTIEKKTFVKQPNQKTVLTQKIPEYVTKLSLFSPKNIILASAALVLFFMFGREK